LSLVSFPRWFRAVQIGLGALTIILSIFALAFPGFTFLSIVVLLSVILLFVGIEKIISGIFLENKSRWATIGLGVLVLIFAGLAMAFPLAAAFVLVIFMGISLLFNGIARIVEGMTGKHSGVSRVFLVGVGILALVISLLVLSFPLFGVVLAGTIIAIGLLITGIQMVFAGLSGTKVQNRTDMP
jgi:uncharacterized membrane protein HdeD (DUF308 family)